MKATIFFPYTKYGKKKKKYVKCEIKLANIERICLGNVRM
jgi:hypothetical protein